MTRGAETKSQTTKRFVGRATLVLMFFAMIALALGARAVHLQVLNKEFLNQQADTRHLRRKDFRSSRHDHGPQRRTAGDQYSGRQRLGKPEGTRARRR